MGIHIFTFNKIPWVEIDFKRHTIENSKEFDKSKQLFNIIAIQNKETGEQKFILPKDKLNDKGQMVVPCGEFGLFRKDGSLVTQMQVNPHSRNDLMWQFPKNGLYTIRSTEYSGPKGGRHMTLKEAVLVTGCDREDVRSIIGGN